MWITKTTLHIFVPSCIWNTVLCDKIVWFRTQFVYTDFEDDATVFICEKYIFFNIFWNKYLYGLHLLQSMRSNSEMLLYTYIIYNEMILPFMKVQSFLYFCNFFICRLLLTGIWLSSGLLHCVCLGFFKS